MPTIANMPAADIDVQFPSGKVKTVNMIRLLVQTQNAEFKVQFGMFLPNVGKLHPTVKAIREEYEFPASIRTWKQAAFWLRKMHTELTEVIREHR
jgi:hypothetical protein